MRVEAGKKYRMRNMRITQLLIAGCEGEEDHLHDNKNGSWHWDGSSCGWSPDRDLIAEITG